MHSTDFKMLCNHIPFLYGFVSNRGLSSASLPEDRTNIVE